MILFFRLLFHRPSRFGMSQLRSDDSLCIRRNNWSLGNDVTSGWNLRTVHAWIHRSRPVATLSPEVECHLSRDDVANRLRRKLYRKWYDASGCMSSERLYPVCPGRRHNRMDRDRVPLRQDLVFGLRCYAEKYKWRYFVVNLGSKLWRKCKLKAASCY